ncbi:MAG: 1-acyl-sn-glycerol-3-phosphate acyltransferase [Chloroflexi bacterium]|nr:1-acyl-sn-glycerol-3-phosphate acyltransferase [Chloroflexota bacterium]
MARYRISRQLLAPQIPSFLIGQPRSLAADCASAFRAIQTTPTVIGGDHIPTSGAFLVVVNHFHRPEIPAWWTAMAVTHAIAVRRRLPNERPIRWLIADQWTYPDPVRRFLVAPVMRFVIGRIARVYDFLTIAPAALGDTRSYERASSIRRVLEAARLAVREGWPLGLAPEGGDSQDGTMMRPPAGAGRFMLLIAKTDLLFLPVGVFTEEGVLVTRFGDTFGLTAPPGLPKGEVDDWATAQVMRRIACLVPPSLRGVYGDGC